MNSEKEENKTNEKNITTRRVDGNNGKPETRTEETRENNNKYHNKYNLEKKQLPPAQLTWYKEHGRNTY